MQKIEIFVVFFPDMLLYEGQCNLKENVGTSLAELEQRTEKDNFF